MKTPLQFQIVHSFPEHERQFQQWKTRASKESKNRQGTFKVCVRIIHIHTHIHTRAVTSKSCPNTSVSFSSPKGTFKVCTTRTHTNKAAHANTQTQNAYIHAEIRTVVCIDLIFFIRLSTARQWPTGTALFALACAADSFEEFIWPETLPRMRWLHH